MSEDKVYEMLWDCKYCGTEKLLGKTHRFCPNCGAAQDDEARYFPSDAEKVAVEDHVYHGADLICSSCDTLNSANADYCQQCGTSLSGAISAKLIGDDQVVRDGQAFQGTEALSVAERRWDEKLETAGMQPDAQTSKKPNIALFAILGVIGLVIIGALIAIFWKQDATGYVTGHSWEREIRIEELASRAESAWCDAMPGDAYSVTRRTEQRGSRQIPDGEECSTRRIDNGDGTFSERRECQTRYRSEPVYDDRCYFTVDRWGYERSARAEGDSINDTPYWPETNIARTGNCLGCEREGQRIADYLVYFQADGDQYTCNLDQQQWASMAVESTWTFQVGVISNQPDCDSLEPAS